MPINRKKSPKALGEKLTRKDLEILAYENNIDYNRYTMAQLCRLLKKEGLELECVSKRVIYNISPNRVSPKGKSPKGKSPKGKSPKGKSPKGKSPKGKSPKGKSPKGRTTKSKSPKSIPKKKEEVPFLENHNLTEEERKYCSCVIKVSEKQSPRCLTSKKWNQKVSGKNCYNPYAICSKTKGSNKKCGKSYDFENFTLEQLLAYCDSRRIRLRRKDERKSKNLVLEKIYEYKNRQSLLRRD